MRLAGMVLVATALLGENAINELTVQEKASGWILLFDGKTMSGWADPRQMRPAGDAWTIEDGCLKANKRPRIREDLLTTQTFRDFELSFEWRISRGGNSGVKYRIQDRVLLQEGKTKPGARKFEDRVDYEYEHRLADRTKLSASDSVEDYPIGFEYQVIDNEQHPDALRGTKQSAGALYSMVGPVKQTARPVGQFNESRIVLRGKHIEHWLNGVKVVDTDLDTPEIAGSLAARWTKTSPVYRLLMTEPKMDCPIGLQNHNDEAWFRNIKLRPL